MGFQVSPGVNVSEIDLTTVVPAVSSTEGAIAGVFKWGPVEQRVLVDSEVTLAARFGKPTNDNAETFFTAANFLAYGNKLYVARVVSSTANNAAETGTANTTIKNEDAFNDGDYTSTTAKVVARYPGALGNSLRVEICDSDEAFSNTVVLLQGSNTLYANVSSNLDAGNSTVNTGISFVVGSNTANVVLVASGSGVSNTTLTDELDDVMARMQVGDVIKVGNSSIGEQYLEISAIASNTADAYTVSTSIPRVTRQISFKTRYTLSQDFRTATLDRLWKYWDTFDSAPTTTNYVAARGGVGDELHVIVVDEDGAITGVPGQILEKWDSMSRATDAKTEDGSSNYYADVINDTSNYIYLPNLPSSSTTASASTALASALPKTYSLVNGGDGASETSITLADLAKGYDLFSDPADVDVSLILTGRANGGTHGENLFNYIIDNICEVRKDCVAFGSPEKADVVNEPDAADKIVEFRNACRSTSYAVLDSGYKYQYDKYNDLYRWIPLNGDVAGLVVRTDDLRDPWFSPGGFNRGQIKNVVKLAYNPRKAYRDVLYKAGVNPVVAFPGQGTILYGDKTLLAKPSAFDRINVRRLFIVLEKAISTAAKFTLFEFNDEFTRAQFVSLVEPFLRDVQGRRGIYDFRVVCDESNNTGEVIDRNEFIGDIYIKPARSINFIQLNFVAVRTGVEFSEVVGKF